jgi:Protein of unknown function (DUF1778)
MAVAAETLQRSRQPAYRHQSLAPNAEVVRVTPEQDALIRQAADLEDTTVTDHSRRQ